MRPQHLAFLVLFVPFCWSFSSSFVGVQRQPFGTTGLKAATGIPLDSPCSDFAETVEEKPSVGILLLNLGGPETGEDVEGTS